MNISWSPDARSGTNCEIHSESKKKHRLFQFLISIHKLLIVLYSMIVISHWLTFVAIYVILSKINVTNKVGQLKKKSVH